MYSPRLHAEQTNYFQNPTEKSASQNLSITVGICMYIIDPVVSGIYNISNRNLNYLNNVKKKKNFTKTNK